MWIDVSFFFFFFQVKKDFAQVFTVHFNDNTTITFAVETGEQAQIHRQVSNCAPMGWAY